jgi:hypothetical protein
MFISWAMTSCERKDSLEKAEEAQNYQKSFNEYKKTLMNTKKALNLHLTGIFD